MIKIPVKPKPWIPWPDDRPSHALAPPPAAPFPLVHPRRFPVARCELVPLSPPTGFDEPWGVE